MAENILANKCQSRAKLEPKPMTKTSLGLETVMGKGSVRARGRGTAIGMGMGISRKADWVRVKFNSATTRANDEQHVANPQLLGPKSDMRMGSETQLWGASPSLLIIIFD